MNTIVVSKAIATVVAVLVGSSTLVCAEGRLRPDIAETSRMSDWQRMRYGMFLHFGMSTFTGNEFDPGDQPSTTYAPKAIEVDQWLRVAKEAGMNYAVLTSKHVAGHCLWDSKVLFRSKEFDYDVATSGNTNDVVRAFVDACQQYRVTPGLYYCLLDFRNNATEHDHQWGRHLLPDDFYELARAQLTELARNYPAVRYYWLDIPRAASDAQRAELYDLLRRENPGCVVMFNCGFLGNPQKGANAEPFTIENTKAASWPTDVLNSERDVIPGVFHPAQAWQGTNYFLGYEHCDVVGKDWFWTPADKARPTDKLFELYHDTVVRAGGSLLLNVGPNRDGKLEDWQISALMSLKQRIDRAKVRPDSVEVFVAPEGNDEAPGTPEAPVKTLARAQRLSRQHRAAGKSATVTLRGGVYYLPETLQFTSEDSGTKTAPVIWRAAEGETPVISGGSKLELTWDRSPNFPGVSQARIPSGLDIDQLWINGQRQGMARFPNRESGAGLNVFDTWKLDHKAKPDPARNPLAPERIARWADPVGAYFHAMHPALWGGVHWRVTGKKSDGSLAMEGGTQNNRGSAMHGVYRMIENVFEELDAPGEWFHDRKASTLYFIPPSGTDLAEATVEIVRLRHLIELQGTSSQPVKWLQFRGLTFRHTARTFMATKEPLLRSDWTIYRGGAVLLTGTEDCEIADCTFDQLGGNAIFVNNYNRRAAIRGCLIAEAGANGICFVGDPAAVRNALFNYDQRLKPADLDRTAGPKSENYPADCLVEDCLIYRSGRVEKQTAPVEIDMAQSITVRHCSIYDVPRAGINIGDGCWGGHVIEFCDVFDTVMETGDHGSFNSWGRDRFWPLSVFNFDDDAFFAANRELPFLDVVRPIILRNNRWRCDHGWDIDLDDGSSNYEIRNNLCLNGGIKNREGFRRIVENNVITASGFHPHVWYKHSGDIFRRNIMASGSYLPARMGKPPWGAEMNFNLVHAAGLSTPKPAAKLAQQSGRDAHSIMADAQFVDPARGDFRVRDGSPALRLGFTNFPMDQFGVQKPSLKAIARTPSFTKAKDNSAAMMFSGITQWQGAKVKSLETIEEASSVGVSLDTGGVMVMELSQDAAAAKAGLRQGDLIIRLGNQPVKNVADLQRLARSGQTNNVSFEVFRDQQRKTLNQ